MDHTIISYSTGAHTSGLELDNDVFDLVLKFGWTRLESRVQHLLHTLCIIISTKPLKKITF